jgi:hypothetical protein
MKNEAEQVAVRRKFETLPQTKVDVFTVWVDNPNHHLTARPAEKSEKTFSNKIRDILTDKRKQKYSFDSIVYAPVKEIDGSYEEYAFIEKNIKLGSGYYSNAEEAAHNGGEKLLKRSDKLEKAAVLGMENLMKNDEKRYKKAEAKKTIEKYGPVRGRIKNIFHNRKYY